MKKIRAAMFHGAGICLNLERAAGVEIAELQELKFLPGVNVEPVLHARWVNGKTSGEIKLLSPSVPARGYERIFGRKERIYWDIRFWWRCRKYDILHYHSHVTGGLIAPHRSVVHIHNLDIGDWYGYPYLTPSLAKLHFIFLSKFLRNGFLEYHRKVKMQQTYVVYSGVDIEEFNVASNPGHVGMPKIIYLSQWSENKGLFVLIEALKKLQHKGYAFVFQLAGDPEMCAVYTHSLRKAIREKVSSALSEMKNVELLGYVPHERLPGILSKASIVVVPSVWQEPYGIVAAEAQAAGLPVVITRVGGLVESAVDNVTGIVVEPNDPDSLAMALARLIESPELRARMGEAGRERARRYFGWEHHAKTIREIYDHILENPGHKH